MSPEQLSDVLSDFLISVSYGFITAWFILRLLSATSKTKDVTNAYTKAKAIIISLALGLIPASCMMKLLSIF